MPEFRKVAVDDLPNTPNPTRAKKEVDEAVGATEFGFNVYEADPGEQVPWGYHRHPDHEELFYVLDGALAFDTPDGEYRVEAGEAFFVPPNAPQTAHAVGDDRARFVAVGAPKDADGAVISEECPACGEETDRDYEVEGSGDDREYVLHCAECGAAVDRFGAGP